LASTNNPLHELLGLNLLVNAEDGKTRSAPKAARMLGAKVNWNDNTRSAHNTAKR